MAFYAIVPVTKKKPEFRIGEIQVFQVHDLNLPRKRVKKKKPDLKPIP